MKRLIKTIAIIDGLIFAVLGSAACFTSARCGTLLIWAGFIITSVGGMAGLGSGNVHGEYNLKFDQKLPQFNYEKSEDKLREAEKSYNLSLCLAIAGTVLIAAGLLLNKVITGQI